MSSPASIKFTQGASTPPAGQALDAVIGTAVNAANASDTNIVSHAWSLVDVPPASALVVGSLGASPAMNPFTPDVVGTYLVKLVTVDSSGLVTQDYRAASVEVDATYGRRHPGSFAGPLALNETSHNLAPGNVGTPNARGYAAFLDLYLAVIDRLRDVGGAAPVNGQALTWVTANNRYEPGAGGGGTSQPSGQLNVPMGDADQVVSSGQLAASMVFNATGALTADRHLTFPAPTGAANPDPTAWTRVIRNSTTGGHNVIVTVGAGTTVTLASGSILAGADVNGVYESVTQV